MTKNLKYCEIFSNICQACICFGCRCSCNVIRSAVADKPLSRRLIWLYTLTWTSSCRLIKTNRCLQSPANKTLRKVLFLSAFWFGCLFACCRCSVSRVKDVLLTWIPILSWLPKYPFRENILGDVVSGCSVGIMHLPQGLYSCKLSSKFIGLFVKNFDYVKFRGG